MKRIRPDYYDKFACIADQCSITCCQEWKIGVDADTNRKWKKIFAGGCPATEKESECLYNGKRRRTGDRTDRRTQMSFFE